NPDTRNCNEPSNWGGNQCQFPKCFGKLSTDGDVCSAQGSCIAPDSCSCNPGYTGNECQLAICYGKSANDSTVCSSKGLCSQPDQCTCFTGYTGEQCQLPICYGKSASDPTVCSGKGTCIEPNNCNCTAGFYGQTCELECPIPSITSSRYTIDATKIQILFNIEMNTQIISCSDLFEDAHKLGMNAICEFSNPSELIITLDSKIASGDTLTFKPNVLKDSMCGLFINETITILAPIGIQVPVAVLNGPSLLGECQDLILESASYGYGYLNYKWELVNNDS